MNNEPVAWIDPKELDMDVSTSVTKNKQFESDIPLYVQPQKYCPSENNEAYEKGFIDGMAKQRDSKVQQMVEGYTHPVKEQDTDCQYCKQGCIRCDARKQLTDEEIKQLAYQHRWNGDVDFARAILRKAQEK
jgi:flagellar biosynthesis/type III secretory pathway protein FliH